MNHYIHQDDAKIVTRKELDPDFFMDPVAQLLENPDDLNLLDSDGDRVHTFRVEDGWNELLVRQALSFANTVYGIGFEVGQNDRSNEIMRLLKG